MVPSVCVAGSEGRGRSASAECPRDQVVGIPQFDLITVFLHGHRGGGCEATLGLGVQFGEVPFQPNDRMQPELTDGVQKRCPGVQAIGHHVVCEART